MHIAVVNGFPSRPNTAEVEYIKRLVGSAASIGHKIYEVVTSEDIHRCAPDFVLTTHEFSPKLTSYFTAGILWSPPAFYETDPVRVKSILSYDAYLPGSPHVGRFLDDLEFSTGVRKPRSAFPFLPTAPRTEFAPRDQLRPFELVYVGVHWDGFRHIDVLSALNDEGVLNVYGPAASWTHFPQSYRGQISFDGTSIYKTLARHGVALCLHKDEHRAADTPSMRLFEAAAAGCLIISDGMPFARRVLGDTAFHLDLQRGPRALRDRILEIIRWANQNPHEAGQMAARSHRILRDGYSIETTVQNCCDFVIRCKEELAGKRNPAAQAIAAQCGRHAVAMRSVDVDIVIRTGTRSLDMLRRAIRSVVEQDGGTYRIILVDFKERDDIRDLAAREQTSRVSIEYIRCPDTGLRSTSLWAGFRQVTARFFAVMDDDDSVMPSHYSSLLDLADKYPEHGLYYSGVIKIEEEPNDYVTAPNFDGPLCVELGEARQLTFLDSYDLMRLVGFDNYIQSNAWIARSHFLDAELLSDPEMSVAEDMYFYLMLARKASFKCSYSPTAYWHWRSSSRENSMLSVESKIWERDFRKLIRRLGPLFFPGGQTFESLRRTLGLRGTAILAGGNWLRSKLKIGEPTQLDSEFVGYSRRFNVHPGEKDGTWTSSTDAHIQLMLSEPVVGRVRLRVGFSAAAGRDRKPQFVNITANGASIFAGEVAPWTPLEAERSITVIPEVSSIFLRARCNDAVVPGGGDPRKLGVFLSSILCQQMD
jgi:glycosyltransferase involved in cell wall biosynthesis